MTPAECDHVASERYYTEKTAAVSSGEAFSEAGEANAERLRKGRWRESGSCTKCGAKRIDSQIGLEQTPAAYVAQIVAAMREVWRVLRDDGTLWLNLGDSYSNKTVGPRNGGTLNQWKDGGRRNPDVADQGIVRDSGMASKQLLGIPWRVAFALQDDGWVLRSDTIWAKPNPMPESVTDRPTKSHEYVFMFAKGKWRGPTGGRFAGLSDSDARWLAMFLDTEGNIVVKRAKRDDGRLWYGAQIAFASSCRELVETARNIVGAGTVLEREGTNAPMFYYQLSNRSAADLLHRIYPFLIVKPRQARIAMYVQALLTQTGKKRPGGFRDEKETALLERLWALNKECNHFGKPDLAFVPEPVYGAYRDCERYYYDAEAIKEGAEQPDRKRRDVIGGKSWAEREQHSKGGEFTGSASRNARSVWQIATQPYSGAHFATMPPELARRCILAGTSARGQCPKCGAPWVRVTEKGFTAHDGETNSAYEKGTTANRLAKLRQAARERGEEYTNGRVTTGWEPSCDCDAGDPVPQIVLDPFSGAGTTSLVASRLGRRSIGTELNPKYVALANDRVSSETPLFLDSLPAYGTTGKAQPSYQSSLLDPEMGTL